MSTHIGNGAHGVMRAASELSMGPTRRGPSGGGLDRRWHSHRAGFLEGCDCGPRAWRVRFLVTDASMPAMATPGIYRLGDRTWSTRRMAAWCWQGRRGWLDRRCAWISAITNVMRMTGVTLVEAIAMATRNPARVGRIARTAARDRGRGSR